MKDESMNILPLLDILQKNTLSFELFPPKTPAGEKQLFLNLEKLSQLNPDFISVTMGAMGSEPGKTFSIVEKIQNEFGIVGVAHLTCVNASKDQILKILEDLKKRDITNLLCLRGDPPQGKTEFTPPPHGFRYASELVAFIRKESQKEFTIGVAAYPEGHVECKNKEEDLKHLKLKTDAGADYVLTQLFFENQYYFDFIKRAHQIGIKQKIIPGIMPITNYGQLRRFTQICGASIPSSLQQGLESIQENEAEVKRFGVEYAAQQCQGLLQSNTPGLHFYILNQPDSVTQILTSLNKTKPFRI